MTTLCLIVLALVAVFDKKQAVAEYAPWDLTLEQFAAQRQAAREAVHDARVAKCRWHDGAHFRKKAWQIAVWNRDDNLTMWRVRADRARRLSSLCTPWYITKQIWAGNILGRESAGDPWPNCPDPYDGSGSSWQGTVDCENGGSWLDSPGFYRCGLQFHPNWENRFGRLCP